MSTLHHYWEDHTPPRERCSPVFSSVPDHSNASPMEGFTPVWGSFAAGSTHDKELVPGSFTPV